MFQKYGCNYLIVIIKFRKYRQDFEKKLHGRTGWLVTPRNGTTAPNFFFSLWYIFGENTCKVTTKSFC